MGKNRNSKVIGFSTILNEAEIHRIPKVWKKMNSHSEGKIWENTNISKLSASEIFRLKQKSMHFPKHGKSGFP